MSCIVSPYLEYQSGRLVKRWGVQYKTCYYMTRKAMQKITDSQKDKMLSGNCEVGELYMQWTERKKLSQYHHISSERLPKRRAVKPPPGRGKFDQDFPMILCYHQRGSDTIFAVPQKYPSIASLVCMIISRGSHIYTDEYKVYHSLESLGYEHHHTVNQSQGMQGMMRIPTTECRTVLFRLWMV